MNTVVVGGDEVQQHVFIRPDGITGCGENFFLYYINICGIGKGAAVVVLGHSVTEICFMGR